jgi:phenylacetate-coenzyme A ligase PaaK-like adenylate-forming protein
MGPRDVFQHRLVRGTLENAVAVPFYEELWAGVDKVFVDDVTWFGHLPTFDKRQYRSSQLAKTRHGAAVARVGFSTGTTGSPLVRVRGLDEVAAYSELASIAAKAGMEEANTRILAFSSLSAAVHGAPSGQGLVDALIQIDTSSDAAVERALATLTSSDIPSLRHGYIRHLYGSPSDLLCLTVALLEKFGTTAIANIAQLVALTNQLTSPARVALESHWPTATVTSRYSLSEIAGGATECGDGVFSFDLTVVPDVVELDSDVSTAPGSVGELVLTELYPFSQVQPFIRYRSGDLARLVSADGNVGPRVELLGRLAANPVVNVNGNSRLLLSVNRLRSRLESCEQVARFGSGFLSGAGLPYAAVEVTGSIVSGAHEVKVIVRCVFSPWLFPAAATSLRAWVQLQVEEELRAMGHDAGACIVSVALESPGAATPVLNSRLGVWSDQADPRANGA